MERDLYSIRMRAEHDGSHCSGAERIAAAGDLPALAAELVARALGTGSGAPDRVHCSVDRLAGEILYRRLPDVQTFDVPDWMTGRACASALLLRAGVAPVAVAVAMAQLAAGPAPGGRVMRGAMIVDALTGTRLEADPARGVRASRMDLVMDARQGVSAELAAAGLGHHRVAEALVLAGKILGAPGIVAELCWSDAPDYLSGYVADPHHGYQRITRMKAAGDGFGGRALFVRTSGWTLEAFVAYLERQAVLFDSLGTIAPPQPWKA
ncbi:MAG: 6-carboxyhexanoate--CoA ligase [Desulfuromonas sp.]|nr:6-carboxyhexanoate--CoA ligase [Desulfuromonas sp.]